MLNMIEGRYKRPGRPGSNIQVVVHADVVIEDGRGVNVPYVFGVRVDDGAPGLIGLFRKNAFLGTPKVTEVDEQAMDVTNWFVTPFGSQGDSWAYLEKVSPEDLFFISPDAKPLADFVVKPTATSTPVDPTLASTFTA